MSANVLYELHHGMETALEEYLPPTHEGQGAVSNNTTNQPMKTKLFSSICFSLVRNETTKIEHQVVTFDH